MNTRPTATVCAVFTVLVYMAGNVVAAPVVNNLSLRGLKIGGSTSITFRGNHLGDNPRLYAPIRFQQNVNEVSDKSVTINVLVDSQIAPNVYPFRMVTDAGISKPFMVSVDRLDQKSQSSVSATLTADDLPIAITGSLTGQQIHPFHFEAKKNETITVDIEGRRLGSQLRPVLRVYDSDDRQVGWAKPSRLIHGDAQLEFTAEESGQYRLVVQDLVYKGPSPGFFRLKIGKFACSKTRYPVAIRAVPGSIPFWSHAGCRLATGSENSGLAPAVFHSSCSEFTEESFSPTDLPFGVTGRLEKKREVDGYEFSVTPETTIRCRVWSHRLGTRLDSQLTIEDASTGKVIGTGDDHDDTLDPLVDVQIPKGVAKVRAKLSSLAGMYGKDCVYRLYVTDEIQPDFAVSADSSEIAIPSGSQVVLPFRVDRKGQKAPIRIRASSESVLQVDSFVAAEHDNRTLVEISAPDQTRAVVPLRFVATLDDRFPEYVRLPSVNPNIPFPPTIDFAAAVVESSPVSIVWTSDPHEITYRGGRFAGRVTIDKPADQSVQLALITTQSPPDEKEKQAKEIRLDNVQNDAHDYSFEIVVPDGYPIASPAHRWAYAVRADLLADDGKSVMASAYTRLRHSTAQEVIELAIKSPTAIQLKIGEKDRIDITGTISRLPQIEHAVNVQLLGIPEDSGITASTATVDAQQGEFTLSVDLSSAKKPVNLDKLSVEARFDSEDASVKDVRRNVGLKIQLAAAEDKPSE